MKKKARTLHQGFGMESGRVHGVAFPSLACQALREAGLWGSEHTQTLCSRWADLALLAAPPYLQALWFAGFLYPVPEYRAKTNTA